MKTKQTLRLWTGIALLATALVGSFFSAHAQDCLEYSAYPFWIDEAATPGSAVAIDQSGDFLFVADGSAGLQVFDAQNSQRPTLVHSMALDGGAWNITIAGGFAYVSAESFGFHVVDIQNPLAPTLVLTVGTAGPCADVFIRDDLALVAVKDLGLMVFDVSDPTAPLLLDSLASPGAAYGVAADLYFAYLADGMSGIQIIDITDPTELELLDPINTPGNAKNVAVKNWTLYAADGTSGLSISSRAPDYFMEARWNFSNNGLDSSYRDIRDPDRTPLHHATLQGEAQFIEIPDDDGIIRGLFTADSTSYATFAPPIEEIHLGQVLFRFQMDTLVTADPSFTDPINFISSDSPGWNAGDFRVGLDPGDGTIFFAQENPATESELTLRTGLNTWEEDVWYQVEISWNDRGREIRVTWSDEVDDYSHLRSDALVSTCFGIGAAENQIASRSENSLTAGLVIDWLIVEDSEPEARLKKTIPLGGYAQDLEFRDDHAFVAVDFGDLAIVDCSIDGLWNVVGTVDTPEHVQSLTMTPLQAYLVDMDAGVQTILCAFPFGPAPLGALETPGSAYGLDLASNFTYVADRDNGLQIVDHSTPAAPILTGRSATAGHAMDVAVSGTYAYVAEATFSETQDKSDLLRALYPRNPFVATGDKASPYSGLQVFDVSDPAAPAMTGTVETPGYALDVAVSGNHAYVADFESFLAIDITDPAAPAIAASLVTPGRPRDLAIQGNLAFVADLQGLQIIDITTPTAPASVGSYATPGPAYGVAVSGSLAFVADVENGLHVIDVTNPASPKPFGTVFTPGGAYDVKVAGNYAYVASGFDTGYSGVQIVDLTTPVLPLLVGCIDTKGSVYSVALQGDNAFVSDGQDGIHIFPVQCDFGASIVPPFGFSLARENGEITFAWKSEPDNEANTYRLRGAKGQEEWAIPFVPDGAGHFSASDPNVGEHSGETVFYSLSYLDSGFIWKVIATEEVYFEAPRIITGMQGIHPNPFNPRTTVSFSVGQPQRVKIRLFDVAGRLVTVLVDQVYDTGHHSADWLGKNTSGGDASSGIYFLRMETENYTKVQKITLVR